MAKLDKPDPNFKEKQEALRRGQKELNKKQSELNDLNKEIIENYLKKQKAADIEEIITSKKDFKIMKQKIERRDSLMRELGYNERHLDSITKDKIFKNNLTSIKVYIAAQNQTAGRKRKSKKRKSKSKKRKSKSKRTIKHK